MGDNIISLSTRKPAAPGSAKAKFREAREGMETQLAAWLLTKPPAAEVAGEVMATIEAVHEMCMAFNVGE
jgi:hypothetical protein